MCHHRQVIRTSWDEDKFPTKPSLCEHSASGWYVGWSPAPQQFAVPALLRPPDPAQLPPLLAAEVRRISVPGTNLLLRSVTTVVSGQDPIEQLSSSAPPKDEASGDLVPRLLFLAVLRWRMKRRRWARIQPHA